MNDYISNQMQLLKYEKSETKDSKTTVWMERDELRIPYIVQYNETFYQFLVRAANRFGEFLYFEDGKLHLGMQPSEGNYKDSKSKVIDWADGANGVQSRHYESVLSESIEVDTRCARRASSTSSPSMPTERSVTTASTCAVPRPTTLTLRPSWPTRNAR